MIVQFGDRQRVLLGSIDDLDAVDRTLRGLIEQMEPSAGTDLTRVDGTASSLRFITRLPASRRRPGTMRAEMWLQVDESHRLVLRWAPRPHVEQPPPALSATVLLQGVAGIAISYRPAGPAQQWRAEWHDRALPTLVRIHIAFAAGRSALVARHRRRADAAAEPPRDRDAPTRRARLRPADRALDARRAGPAGRTYQRRHARGGARRLRSAQQLGARGERQRRDLRRPPSTCSTAPSANGTATARRTTSRCPAARSRSAITDEADKVNLNTASADLLRATPDRGRRRHADGGPAGAGHRRMARAAELAQRGRGPGGAVPGGRARLSSATRGFPQHRRSQPGASASRLISSGGSDRT